MTAVEATVQLAAVASILPRTVAAALVHVWLYISRTVNEK